MTANILDFSQAKEKKDINAAKNRIESSGWTPRKVKTQFKENIHFYFVDVETENLTFITTNWVEVVRIKTTIQKTLRNEGFKDEEFRVVCDAGIDKFLQMTYDDPNDEFANSQLQLFLAARLSTTSIFDKTRTHLESSSNDLAQVFSYRCYSEEDGESFIMKFFGGVQAEGDIEYLSPEMVLEHIIDQVKEDKRKRKLAVIKDELSS